MLPARSFLRASAQLARFASTEAKAAAKGNNGFLASAGDILTGTTGGAHKAREATKLRPNKADSAQKTQENSGGASAKAAAPKTAKPKRTHEFPFNSKLQDISKQVSEAVLQAQPNTILEAQEIFEEAVVYLREVREAEGIAEEQLYFRFAPMATTLMEKTVEYKLDPEPVLAMLCANGLGHAYHFLQIQQQILKTTPGAEAYTKVLSLWIDYLQALKAAPTPRIAAAMARPTRQHMHYRDPLQLAYFALVMLCVATGTDYDVNQAVKILQLESLAQLPAVHHVTNTLRRWGLQHALSAEISQFAASAKEKTWSANGPATQRRLEVLALGGTRRQINTLFEEMQGHSSTTGEPLGEDILRAVMNAYVGVGAYAEALAIFGQMTKSLAKLPLAMLWDSAFVALSHSSKAKSMSREAQDAAAVQLEKTFLAMEASGVPVNARTLGTFVGGLANLGKMPLAEEYLAKYPKVPMIHRTRDRLLLGLLTQGAVADAETRLLADLSADNSYKPSTDVMNSFLAHYTSAEDEAGINKVFAFMAKHSIPQNISTVTISIKHYFESYRRRGLVPDIGVVLQDLSTSSLRWDSHLVTSLLDGLARDGLNLPAARAVSKYFFEKDLRIKHSRSVLVVLIRSELLYGSIHNAEETFDFCVKNVESTERLWNQMISALLYKDEALARNYYQRFKEQRSSKVAPNLFTYYLLLHHFTRTHNAEQIQWVLDELADANLSDLGTKLPDMVRSLAANYKVKPLLLQAVSS